MFSRQNTHAQRTNVTRWLKRIFLALIAGAAVILASPLLLAGLMLLGLAYLFRRECEIVAAQNFRRKYSPAGKDLLLVYSTSPHWQRYVETEWLPKWGHRAVVLNWSERRQWQGSAPEVTLFREFVGGGGFSREYNPVAVIVPPRGRRVHIVRFWRAFRDYKHGRTRRLREAEAELERGLTTVQS